MKKLIFVFCLSFLSPLAFASESIPSSDHQYHSGGTDDKGCHHDHKRGGYHCH